MKFGLTRARIGDIIPRNEGADIIVLKENAEYLKNSLQELIRFKKSEIEIKNIPNVESNEPRRIKNVEHQDKVPTDIGG